MKEILSHSTVPTLFEDSNWQRCFEAFSASFKSPKTQAFYANILSRFFQGRDPGTITKADIEAFLSQDLASATVITRTSCLRSFYKFASTYMVSGKKRLYASTLPTDGIQHRNHPTNGPKARITIPAGIQLPPHVHLDYKETTPATSSTTDVLTQRRREVLAVILNDFLGDRPAVELAPYLAGNPLVTASGPFLFASNKVMPHPLGAVNLRKLVDYFELIADNEHVWCSAYWRIANELASRLSPEKQHGSM